LTNRSGLENEWDAIDRITQLEIKHEWTVIVRRILDGTSETQGYEPHQTPMSVSPEWKADGTGFRGGSDD
jgi:hypothetical protein